MLGMIEEAVLLEICRERILRGLAGKVPKKYHSIMVWSRIIAVISIPITNNLNKYLDYPRSVSEGNKKGRE